MSALAPPARPAARRPSPPPSTLWTPDGFPTPDMLAGAGDPPDGLAISREDCLALETAHPVEWVDGRLSYLPMTTESHQIISGFFYDLLRSAAKAAGHDAIVIYAPFFVEVPHRLREPDLVMLLDRSDPRRGDAKWTGADLAVEIVSPSDPNRDLVEKRTEYAAAGVAEYWVVDPRPRRRSAPTGRSVTVLTPGEDGAYTGEPVDEGGTAQSRLLPGFTAAVADCLADA